METPPFPKGKFEIIYADPPWTYERRMKGKKRDWIQGAHTHYPTLSQEELAALPVESLADKDCLLFLWVVSPLLDGCLEVGRAWGFKYVTVGFVWDKMRPLAGSYTMSQCEMCLIFKRGAIPKPRDSRNQRQLVTEKSERHSKKPDAVRERIELMFPLQRKIELFAREKHADWTPWGLEV